MGSGARFLLFASLAVACAYANTVARGEIVACPTGGTAPSIDFDCVLRPGQTAKATIVDTTSLGPGPHMWISHIPADAGSLTFQPEQTTTGSSTTATLTIAPGMASGRHGYFVNVCNSGDVPLPVCLVGVVTFNVVRSAPPKIFWEGKDVTGTTQEAVVGQRIVLRAQNPGEPPASIWEVGGTTIGGYTPTSDSFATGRIRPADFSTSTTFFYWTSTGTRTVKYTAHNAGDVQSAQVFFKVKGPVGAPTFTLGQVQVHVEKGRSYLGLGQAKEGLTGLEVFATERGAVVPGSFFWVQIMEETNLVINDGAGTRTCRFGSGLDNRFPYPEETPTSASDSPRIGLKTGYLRVALRQRLKMYSMWQSSMPRSIPVPLGNVTWSWDGAASYNKRNDEWILRPGAVRAASSQRTAEYPVWNKVVTNNPVCR